jgi:D-amino-acid oxidase
MQVLVLGAGVSGLSCATLLLEAGFAVRIRTRERTPHTTSDTAAAAFYPFRTGPDERVLPWGRDTLRRFQHLAMEASTGVAWVDLQELFTAPTPDPWWKDILPEFRRLAPEELPEGFTDGWTFRTIRIEMPVYLRHLENRFLEQGGRIESGEVTDLASLAAAHPLIVNCTGLGARQVAGDERVFPIRGQIVRVRPADGIRRARVHDETASTLAYVVPRANDLVLGGTYQDDDWNLRPDADDEAGIVERCRRIEPQLGEFEIVSRAVGLRPGRASVRLEVERLGERCSVVHDYGHGGYGVTLSWGCAAEVVHLVRQETERLPKE